MADLNLRPLFHITGRQGWINDPNGLVKFKDDYHVFFQHYAQNVYWGPMHWGHVKSKDLLNWEYLPVAISPDEQDDGCFSGTAIVHDGKLYLLYTSYKFNGGGENIRQLQALASSEDGIHFKKHGIVIGESDLPEQYSACDFRDPKVFKDGDNFYCLVAARRKEGRGRILLFTSKNLFDWTFVRDLLDCDSGGIMIECPDFVKGLGLLTYCEQFQPPQGYKHLNIHSTFYRTGDIGLNGDKSHFGDSEIIDYGFDFYAAQIFAETPVMIGWLSMWDRNAPYDKFGFSGMLTVPRKISVENGRLLQYPLFEGERALTVNGFEVNDRATCGVIEIDVKNLESLKLELRVKGDRRTVITATGNELIFDRSASGEKIEGKETDGYSLAGIRKMPLENISEHKITVVCDLFSVEIFADGRALSSVICPDCDADGIRLTATAESCTYTRYDVSSKMSIRHKN